MEAERGEQLEKLFTFRGKLGYTVQKEGQWDARSS